MFGINGSEFLVLVVVAAIVLGPERLPQYAQQLARLVKELRRMAQGATEQIRSEMGPEFDQVDWRKLDPRQYDPRRIVREALSDVVDPDDPLGLKEAEGADEPSPDATAEGERYPYMGSVPAASTAHEPELADGAAKPAPVPFDPDAT